MTGREVVLSPAPSSDGQVTAISPDQRAATRRKVLLVSLSQEFGGAETYYVKLARMLARVADVRALVLNQKLAAGLKETGVEKTACPTVTDGLGGIYRTGFQELLQILRQERPQVVHFNGAHETYLAPIARVCGVPFVITRHNQLDTPPLRPRLKKPFLLNQLRAAQGVICVSDQLYRELAPEVGTARLRMIPTWVSRAGLPRGEQHSLHTPLRLLYVGRLIPEKGIRDLIEAMRFVQGASLLVVGDGPELESCRVAAQGLPVTFAGFSRNIEEHYAQADLLVFPSREGYEGLPQVPLEAMSSGLPCLFSDISATRELAGPLDFPRFQPGNPEDLAKGVNALIAQPHELSRLSRMGIERVLANYTEAAVEQRYREALQL